MIPCISQVTVLPTPFGEDLAAFGRAGWPAVELWLTKVESFLETHSLAEVRNRLEGEGLRALAAASQGGLLLTRDAERLAHRDQLRRRLDLLQGLGVPTLILAADLGAERGRRDYGAAVAALAQAGEIARPAGVRLALEFQARSAFCASLDTALALVAQADAANVGVCLDLFHYYCGPSKFEDLGLLTAGRLAWVQLCDLAGVPREVAGDSDRILPGEGDFQLDPILAHLDRIGYDGGVALEILNPQFWNAPVDLAADAGLQALRRVLGGPDRAGTGGGN
jgi:sugar phosphate isomerase/epimerase